MRERKKGRDGLIGEPGKGEMDGWESGMRERGRAGLDGWYSEMRERRRDRTRWIIECGDGEKSAQG